MSDGAWSRATDKLEARPCTCSVGLQITLQPGFDALKVQEDEMIKFIAFAAFAFALALATSAQAMPRVPLHQPDGMTEADTIRRI